MDNTSNKTPHKNYSVDKMEETSISTTDLENDNFFRKVLRVLGGILWNIVYIMMLYAACKGSFCMWSVMSASTAISWELYVGFIQQQKESKSPRSHHKATRKVRGASSWIHVTYQAFFVFDTAVISFSSIFVGYGVGAMPEMGVIPVSTFFQRTAFILVTTMIWLVPFHWAESIHRKHHDEVFYTNATRSVKYMCHIRVLLGLVVTLTLPAWERSVSQEQLELVIPRMSKFEPFVHPQANTLMYLLLGANLLYMLSFVPINSMGCDWTKTLHFPNASIPFPMTFLHLSFELYPILELALFSLGTCPLLIAGVPFLLIATWLFEMWLVWFFKSRKTSSPYLHMSTNNAVESPLYSATVSQNDAIKIARLDCLKLQNPILWTLLIQASEEAGFAYCITHGSISATAATYAFQFVGTTLDSLRHLSLEDKLNKPNREGFYKENRKITLFLLTVSLIIYFMAVNQSSVDIFQFICAEVLFVSLFLVTSPKYKRLFPGSKEFVNSVATSIHAGLFSSVLAFGWEGGYGHAAKNWPFLLAILFSRMATETFYNVLDWKGDKAGGLRTFAIEFGIPVALRLSSTLHQFGALLWWSMTGGQVLLPPLMHSIAGIFAARDRIVYLRMLPLVLFSPFFAGTLTKNLFFGGIALVYFSIILAASPQVVSS